MKKIAKPVKPRTITEYNMRWHVYALSAAFNVLSKHGLLEEYYNKIKRIPKGKFW